MATGRVDGLISGMDTTTIVSQLMSLERLPVTRLEAKKSQANAIIGIYQQLNTRFSALQGAGLALARTTDWRTMRAVSSDATAVSASATSAAQAGGLSFKVTQLSRAGAVASSGTVASGNVVVATGRFLVSKGADQIGFASLGSGSGLSLGAHTIEVTEATTAAVKSGTSALDVSTDLGAGGTVQITVDGQARTWNIAGGVYNTREALAAAVQAAADQAGAGEVAVSVGSDGAPRIATTREGSAATLTITGGTAVAALKLTDLSAATGEAGEVVVDGTTIAITDAKAGETNSLAGANGTVDIVFSGGLRKGTVTATNVDTGNGSLDTLVSAVNGANAGVTAAAVKVGTDSYRLQLSSTTTGAASNVSTSTAGLAGLGSFGVVQAGRDAKILVGEGAGAYEVSSATDSMTGVLAGVTFSLKKADPDTTVTVTVSRDAEALADKVQALVDAANGALSYIKAQAAYDPATKKAGALLADGQARRLQDQVLRAVSDAVGQSSLGSAGFAGVSLARDGSVSFDRTKFLGAYANDPGAVEKLFRQGGTADDSSVSFLSAGAKVQAGTYAVDITTAAEQAKSVGTDLLGLPLAAAETVSVRVGGVSGTTAAYAAAAGESLDSVVLGLNAAFAGKGLAVTATISAGALAIRTAAYGEAAAFEVSTDTPGQTGIAGGAAAGVWVEHEGVDVAGTIDGRAATGAGQILTVGADDTRIPSLALTITATDPGADLGNFAYQPGVAQRLNSVAALAIEFGTGSISTAISGRQDLIRDIDSRIESWDVRLAKRELNLRRQFSSLEVALGKLRDQSNWLAGQLAGLSGNNG